MRIVETDVFKRLERLLIGKVVTGGPKKLAKGTVITKEYLDSIDLHHWFDIRLADEDISRQLEQMKEGLEQKQKLFDSAFEEKRKKLTQGDELPPGVQKWLRFMWLLRGGYNPAIRWLEGMEIKGLFRKSFQ